MQELSPLGMIATFASLAIAFLGLDHKACDKKMIQRNQDDPKIEQRHAG